MQPEEAFRDPWDSDGDIYALVPSDPGSVHHIREVDNEEAGHEPRWTAPPPHFQPLIEQLTPGVIPDKALDLCQRITALWTGSLPIPTYRIELELIETILAELTAMIAHELQEKVMEQEDLLALEYSNQLASIAGVALAVLNDDIEYSPTSNQQPADRIAILWQCFPCIAATNSCYENAITVQRLVAPKLAGIHGYGLEGTTVWIDLPPISGTPSSRKNSPNPSGATVQLDAHGIASLPVEFLVPTHVSAVCLQVMSSGAVSSHSEPYVIMANYCQREAANAKLFGALHGSSAMSLAALANQLHRLHLQNEGISGNSLNPFAMPPRPRRSSRPICTEYLIEALHELKERPWTGGQRHIPSVDPYDSSNDSDDDPWMVGPDPSPGAGSAANSGSDAAKDTAWSEQDFLAAARWWGKFLHFARSTRDYHRQAWLSGRLYGPLSEHRAQSLLQEHGTASLPPSRPHGERYLLYVSTNGHVVVAHTNGVAAVQHTELPDALRLSLASALVASAPLAAVQLRWLLSPAGVGDANEDGESPWLDCPPRAMRDLERPTKRRTQAQQRPPLQRADPPRAAKKPRQEDLPPPEETPHREPPSGRQRRRPWSNGP